MEQWQDIANFLKSKTWDITEEWLEEVKNNLIWGQSFLSLSDEDIIGNVPTIIGGIANVIQDPVFLEDFQPGGHMYSVAAEMGRARQNKGYPIEKVLADFSLLRQKIWDFCKNRLPIEPENFFELQRRLNQTIDKMLENTIQSFHQKSSTELLELAFKDKLTGFLHLKALLQIADSEVMRARRYHRSLSFAIIDIDSFHRFNLEHGRLAGNQLLQSIAQNITQLIRITDKTARIGGDEFGILMPETTTDEAKIALERIRRQIRQETHRQQAMATLSIGIASYPDNAANCEDLFNEGRSALISAQKDGGDRIAVALKKN